MIPFSSVLEEITIDLKSWKIKTEVKDIDS